MGSILSCLTPHVSHFSFLISRFSSPGGATTMTTGNFNRGAGLAALGVAVFNLLYALFFLVLTPAAQRGTDTAAFYSSFAANPGPYLASWWILLISGLL